eukprot:COSAG01_NODE_2043_length_8564_cov_76.365859_7_plen_87_part_00
MSRGRQYYTPKARYYFSASSCALRPARTASATKLCATPSAYLPRSQVSVDMKSESTTPLSTFLLLHVAHVHFFGIAWSVHALSLLR